MHTGFHDLRFQWGQRADILVKKKKKDDIWESKLEISDVRWCSMIMQHDHTFV